MIEYVWNYKWATGWVAIVEKLLDDVNRITGDHRVRMTEFKEKYGSLRTEFEPVGTVPIDIMSEIEKLIRSAEDESERTCITCGAAGLLHDWRGEWILPLCPEHARERIGDDLERYAGDGWRLDANWRLVDVAGKPLDAETIAEFDAAAARLHRTKDGIEYVSEATRDWMASRWVAK